MHYPNPDEDWVVTCKLLHTHGNRGELFGQLLTDFPSRLTGPASVHILLPGQQPKPFELEKVRNHKGGVLLKFQGIETISEAEGLIHGHLVAKKSELEPLQDGSYYYFDIIGCQAIDEAGREIGEVSDIHDYSGNQLLVIRQENREILVSISRTYIKELNCRQKRIVLNLPEELQRLNL